MQISSLGQKQEPENSNVKKYVLIALIISFILLIIVLICMVLFSSMKTTPLTLIVDGETKPFKEETFIFDNNNIYVSLEDISNLIGYKYYRGAYGGDQQYTEDNTKCYLDCNDEVVTYELKQYSLYKTPKDVTNQYSEFTMSEPIKRNNNKLYVISSGLETGCNLKLMYNQKTNQIIINTLPGLYKVYNDKAEEGAYTNVDSISDNFNNKKAILYDMLVVKSGNKYGVTALDGVTTKIGTKYDEMEFIENTQEFLVKANDRYGIITKDGVVKIGINYSKIELLDNANGLYYAVNASNKKGVLRNGKILGRLYVEYDEIGINPVLFPSDDIKNPRLLYDNCIPVKKDNKWGMFDITGNMISNFYWDSFRICLHNFKFRKNI